MTGFFSKLFGGSKKKEIAPELQKVVKIVEDTMGELISIAAFQLEFNVVGGEEPNELFVQMTGTDEELLTEKEGILLDSFQLYIKRVIQHHLPEDRTNIYFDCNNFREESNQALVDLAEKLKGIVIEKNRSVYCRALPPKDRKVIHQYLAADTRVKSRSIGEGLYKKIKIYPAREKGNRTQNDAHQGS
jgi:spoIIIJ-associated protein